MGWGAGRTHDQGVPVSSLAILERSMALLPSPCLPFSLYDACTSSQLRILPHKSANPPSLLQAHWLRSGSHCSYLSFQLDCRGVTSPSFHSAGVLFLEPRSAQAPPLIKHLGGSPLPQGKVRLWAGEKARVVEATRPSLSRSVVSPKSIFT